MLIVLGKGISKVGEGFGILQDVSTRFIKHERFPPFHFSLVVSSKMKCFIEEQL